MNKDEQNNWTTVQSSIVNELNDVNLKSFVSKIDKDYENAMMECVGFTKMCEELVPTLRLNSYYDFFRRYHRLFLHFHRYIGATTGYRIGDDYP